MIPTCRKTTGWPRIWVAGCLALGFALTTLVPQVADAQPCEVSNFIGNGNQILNENTDCLELNASPRFRFLDFQDDVNFQVVDGYACWENTTMQSTTGRPIDVRFETLDPAGAFFDVFFRTLTLNNVNFDPNGFSLKWPGASDIALTLENAWVILDPTPLWPADSPLTLEAIGGDNLIERLTGNLDSPTTLTVADDTNLLFVGCGTLGSGLPDNERCNFQNAGNSADIQGILELKESYVIFNTSGGDEMLVHNGGSLLLSSTGSVLQTGSLRVDGGSVEMATGTKLFADLGLINASLGVEGNAEVRSFNAEVGGPGSAESTVFLGSNPSGADARLFAEVLLEVDIDDTLTLAGYGRAVAQELRLLTGATVRITESSSLAITGPASSTLDASGSSIEIAPEALLSIPSGGDVSSSIPIANNGTVSVGGTFKPSGVMSGDGQLQVFAGGTLGPLGINAVDTFTASPQIILDGFSTFKPLINPTIGEAQKLIASTSLSLSPELPLANGVYLEPIVIDDIVLAPGTQFVIVEYPEGNDLGGLFVRDDLSKLRDGDEITLGQNTYRINYNPTNITLTVVDPERIRANDDYYTALQDQTLTVPAPGVLGNDVNYIGTPAVVDGPMHGTVTLNPNGSFTYTPNAGFSGDDTFAYVVGSGETQSNVATVYIHVRAQRDCTLSSGYWLTHAGNNGAAYDTTWLELAQGPATPFFLSGETYLEVLSKDPEGNAYYILAQQYIAAELNFLRGADPSVVQTQFDQAKVLFEQYTPAEAAALESGDREVWISLGLMLDMYNNGEIGPGVCPEEI